MRDFTKYLLQELKKSDIEEPIKNFFQSRSPGIIYGGGVQAIYTFEMSCLFEKEVLCTIISDDAKARAGFEELTDLPLYRVSEVSPALCKNDIVIAVSEEHNDVIKLTLHDKSFQKIYMSDDWKKTNGSIYALLYRCFAEFFGFDINISEDNTRYFQLKNSDYKLHYPYNEILLINMQHIYSSVIEQGIPCEDFIRKNCKPKSCPHMGDFFVVEQRGVATCCAKNGYFLPTKGNIKDDVEQYNNANVELSKALKMGIYTTCQDCYMLEDSYSYVEMNMRRIAINSGLPGGEYCNFKCSYCYFQTTSDKTNYNENIYEVLLYLTNAYKIEVVVYSSGELTISPFRNDVLKLWEKLKWKGTIHTNAALYNETITNLLSEKLININCSLDAGTQETFAKVKGADCFENVVENLSKYAQAGGKIVLKYVLLEGLNDNDVDIDEFVKIAKKTNAEVSVSRNASLSAHTNEREWTMIARLVHECKKLGLHYSLVKEYFTSSEIDRFNTI